MGGGSPDVSRSVRRNFIIIAVIVNIIIMHILNDVQTINTATSGILITNTIPLIINNMKETLSKMNLIGIYVLYHGFL